MKDLEAQTGVSREAIHFYLREGLLPQPERPKRNVAFYRDEHVVRIRAIKRLQAERSLSLEAIRTMLQGFDYDALPTSDDLASFELTVLSHVNGDLPAHNQSVDAVAARTGMRVADLWALHDAGVIHIVEADDAPQLDFRDVGIVDQWAKVLRMGFHGKTGYDAGYLERYATAINAIAELEVANFLDVFGEMPTDEAAELAARGIALTNDIFARMRTQALMRHLHARVDG